MSQASKGLQQSVVRVTVLILAIAIVPPGTIGPVARAQEASPRAGKRLLGDPGQGRPVRRRRDRDGEPGAGANRARLRRRDHHRDDRHTQGRAADKVAVKLAEHSGIHGLFVLIARKERKLEVLASRHYREVVTEARRKAIREAFFEGFHRQDFNEGLKLGVAAIGKALATVHREETHPGRRSPRP